MPHIATVAACSLNQWALDFEGNLDRIKKSILEAKRQGARVRVGPELEVCGYGCADHFLEADTFKHSWAAIAQLLRDPDLHDILIDTGMPVFHKNTRYNCRVLLLQGRILLIRPKMFLANSGNYRESRWFSCWMRPQTIEAYHLNGLVREVTGQDTVPFGDAVIRLDDTTIGCEVCEELFTANSPHSSMGLDGVEIFLNGSASHWEAGKLRKRHDLVKGATGRTGGIYLYANQHGIDGEANLYYDGAPFIAANGELVAVGEQCCLKDVHVVTAQVDLDDLRVFRGLTQSLGNQGAAFTSSYPQITVSFRLTSDSMAASPPVDHKYLALEEELALIPPCWLWDYLKKSGASGFFLALSGGADSASCALLVHSMSMILFAAAKQDLVLANEIKQVIQIEDWQGPEDLTNVILHTAYISTENSSPQTRQRASDLAQAISSYHVAFPIDALVSGAISTIKACLNLVPRFRAHGGSRTENLALQNLQARLRMVLAYFYAQLLPVVRGREGRFLLVLATANLDEGLRGYFTKYDNSSGDLNPIGSISKGHLNRLLRHMQLQHPKLAPPIKAVLDATPTAELEPGHTQADETDMGFTYAELAQFGQLRGIFKAGPSTMLSKLLASASSAAEARSRVESFFYYYAVNRHKMVTMTNTLHAMPYNIDNHRFDQRPFLYRNNWAWILASLERDCK